MNRNGRKAFFTWFIRIIIFAVFISLFWMLLGFIRPYLEMLLASITDSELTETETIASILSVLIDFALSAVITPFVTKHIESAIIPPQKAPKILISAPHSSFNNISGVKTTHSYSLRLCVKVGQDQSHFRIVYAQIKNIGESAITGFLINKQELNIILEQNQSSLLYFIVSESFISTQRIRTIDLPYCVQDDQGDVYAGKYCMQFDHNLSGATFRPKKKLKRSWFKNAL